MANPTTEFDGSIDGVWLIPHASGAPVAGKEAWLGAPSPDLEAEVSSDEFTIFNRREELSQDGALHLDKGEISGLLIDRHGLTADEWLDRLQDLVRDQRSYGKVELVSPRFHFKVKLKSLAKRPTIAGGRAWEVTVAIRQVS